MLSESLQMLLNPITIQIGIILTLTMGISYGAKHLLQRLENSKSAPDLLKLLYQSWHTSLHWLIGIYGILFALEVLVSYTLDKTPYRHMQFCSIYAIFSITWLLLCWKSQFQKLLIKKTARRKLNNFFTKNKKSLKLTTNNFKTNNH